MKRNLFVLFLGFLTVSSLNAQTNRPQASAKAIVKVGDARFTVLTPQLIRMEWSKNGIFEDKASLVFINRNLPVPNFTSEKKGKWFVIHTDKLDLHYQWKSGRFTRDNLYVTLHLNGHEIKWFPGLKDSLNLKGTTRTLDGTNGAAGRKITLGQGIISRSGWAVVDDSKRLLFDGSKDWNWVVPRVQDSIQDLYFFGYGHNYKKALFDFTRVAGKIPMPPRFAFGYWWSRYWTYSDAELRTLITDFKNFNIPIDVLVIDMDWHNTWGLDYRWKTDIFGQPIGWTGYTWNKNLFPDPERFLAWAKQQGLKTALNLHPASGIAPMETQYSAFAKAYGFDTIPRQNIPFRMDDKKWAETYFKVVIHPLEKQGVNFWWLDWQQWLMNKRIKNLSNTWWLNYTFFTDMEREGRDRPLIFHRWGGLGNHRYQIGFSGDALSSWNSLAYEPYFTATAANVGYGYWSHDIGGHIASNPDPELYLRWIQFGVFSPILRTHCSKSAYNERRIWKFPGQFNRMRNALELRYALNPYIYTASREAYDSGISICRPMYYDYPKNENAYRFKGQYMFGDDMLIAPITSKADSVTHLSFKMVWLPKGTWFDYFTGTLLKGDTVVVRNYSLSEIPVFIKAGSIIPMDPEIRNLKRVVDTLILTVIPGGSGETRLYEDDGVSDNYKSGAYAFTHITNAERPDGDCTFTIFPRKGTFKGMDTSRSYEIRFMSVFPPSEMWVNNRKVRYSYTPAREYWTYEGKTLTAVLHIPETPCNRKVTVRFVPSGNTKGKVSLLQGKPGLFDRLPQSAETMKYESAKIDWVANMPECLLDLAAIPSRITYEPGKTLNLLETADTALKPCILTLRSYSASSEKILEKVTVPLIVNSEKYKTIEKPVINIDQRKSQDPGTMRITGKIPGEIIHFTLDGSLPNEKSPVYRNPLELKRSSVIKARAYDSGYLPSFTSVAYFQRIMADTVTLAFPCSAQYSGGNKNALIDGLLGDIRHLHLKWIGFHGSDMIATIALNQNQVHSVTARFLQYQNVWVFLPTYLKYEISSDGITYKTIYEKSIQAGKQGDNAIFEYKCPVSQGDVRYIRVTAKNLGQCPAWHQGAGQKAWLFTDELILE